MRRATSVGRRIVIVVASVGWLVPMALGTWTVLAFLRTDVSPRLQGEAPTHSFPFVDFAGDCFGVGFAWLAIVATAWALTMTRGRPAETAADG